MRYKVGDLVAFKKFIIRAPGEALSTTINPKYAADKFRRPLPTGHSNTLGVIVEAVHFKKAIRRRWVRRRPGERDNLYIWLSSIDSQPYVVFEDELEIVR